MSFGRPPSGVFTLSRSLTSSPVPRSTTAPLMPVPPMSMPIAWSVAMAPHYRATIAGYRRGPGGASGERQDLRAALGHDEGVLELRGERAIARDDRPVVVPDVPFDGAERQHRLDGEHHPGLHDGVELGRVVVRDHEARVERATHPVARVVAHDSVPEPLR